MPRKNTPKKIYKKNIVKRSAESRTVSFLIGVITVSLIALVIFAIAQGKNYKSVLGQHTNIQNAR